MKKGQIIGLVVIAIAVAIVLTTFDDASSYVDFATAKEMAENGEKGDIHIVGELKKNASGDIVGMHYDPVKDPNLFTFTVIDEGKKEQQVIYFNSKPADLEKSEKIVIIGHFKGNQFIAKDILLKCPSKYNEETIKTENT